MKLSEAIDITRRHNAWRRDNSGAWEMLPPEVIGQALDALCGHAERLERELEQERAIVASLRGLVTADHENKEAFIRRCRQTVGINEAGDPP